MRILLQLLANVFLTTHPTGLVPSGHSVSDSRPLPVNATSQMSLLPVRYSMSQSWKEMKQLLTPYLLSVSTLTFDSFFLLQCQPSFLGNITNITSDFLPEVFTSCTPDSDGDSYPEVALSDLPECAQGCPDTTGSIVPSYCCNDTCPFIYNPDQSQLPCKEPTDPNSIRT